jgi:hypothetical protein
MSVKTVYQWICAEIHEHASVASDIQAKQGPGCNKGSGTKQLTAKRA